MSLLIDRLCSVELKEGALLINRLGSVDWTGSECTIVQRSFTKRYCIQSPQVKSASRAGLFTLRREGEGAVLLCAQPALLG